MKKQYAVLGLGRFGYAVAVTLAQAGNQVLAVDSSEELVQEISDYVTYAVRADITDTNVFASLGISDMDVVIVGIAQNMQASILATIQSKEAGVPYVIAKCLSKIHADILTRVGADKVIMAEYETGVRLAKILFPADFVICLSCRMIFPWRSLPCRRHGLEKHWNSCRSAESTE